MNNMKAINSDLDDLCSQVDKWHLKFSPVKPKIQTEEELVVKKE